MAITISLRLHRAHSALSKRIFPVAFARYYHGLREALSRRSVRSRGDFTASNDVFLIKIHVDEKKMQTLNMKKANKTLFCQKAETVEARCERHGNAMYTPRAPRKHSENL